MKLRYTAKAASDVDAIFERIATTNPAAALTVVRRIDRAIQGLLAHPERGRTGRVAGTRGLVIRGLPYLAAYAVRNGSIDILAVVHGARSWPSSFDASGPSDPG